MKNASETVEATMTLSSPLFSFIHCADLHLDSPFEGIHAIDPKIASVLRGATFKAFDNVINTAIQERVDFLIVAGDVYDGADRSLQAQLRFRDGLIRASQAGIECFISHGNHDPLSGWEANLTMPKNVHRFGGEDVEMISIEQKGIGQIHVYGISFATRDVKQNLASRFQRADDADFAIGVLHCNVGGRQEHDNYAPCSVDDLFSSGMDYWALGHIHTREIINEHNPCIVYPGNLQGRSVRETGARGCYLVRVGQPGKIEQTFVESDVVRWFDDEETGVDISGLTSVDDLLSDLVEICESVRDRANGRAAMVRLRIIGRGELHGLLRRIDFERDLLQRLREGEAERSDFVWVESLRVATQPVIDLEQRRNVEDFVGFFLKAAQSLRQNDQANSEIRNLLQKRPENTKISEQLEALSEAELISILHDAEILGIDRLLGEEG